MNEPICPFILTGNKVACKYQDIKDRCSDCEEQQLEYGRTVSEETEA